MRSWAQSRSGRKRYRLCGSNRCLSFFEFGPKGEFIRESGAGLYGWSFAHTVRIDRDDNIWPVDKGSNMIIKFNQAGRVVCVFGRRKESAEESEPWAHVNPPLLHVDGLFRQPTDVAFDSDGNIYFLKLPARRSPRRES